MIRKLIITNLALLSLLLATAVVNAWTHGTIAQSLYLALTGGTMTGAIGFTLPDGTPGSATFLTVAPPNSSARGPWALSATTYPTGDGGGGRNDIMAFGWNLLPSGSGGIVNGQPSGGTVLENSFLSNMEYHLAEFYDGNTATAYRVADVYFDWATDVAQIYMSADHIDIWDTSHTNEWITFDSNGATSTSGGTVNVQTNSQIYLRANNQAVVIQENAAGNGVVNYPYVNASNNYYFPAPLQVNASALPTSCAGKPSGTVWNNSNVLTLCP